MGLTGKSRGLAALFAICTVLTVSGCFYLDTRIAGFITHALGDGFLFSQPVSNMPDFLLPLVCILTFASWTSRLWLLRKPARQRYAELFEYVGSALPLAFVMKSVLKEVFGRVDTRVWLLHPHALAFHWFEGGGNYSGFPSGHMAIFTVLALEIGRSFPRLRLPCAGLLLALALALMITQYHFLSGIAAGVLVGALADLLARRALALLHRRVGCQRRSAGA